MGMYVATYLMHKLILLLDTPLYCSTCLSWPVTDKSCWLIVSYIFLYKGDRLHPRWFRDGGYRALPGSGGSLLHKALASQSCSAHFVVCARGTNVCCRRAHPWPLWHSAGEWARLRGQVHSRGTCGHPWHRLHRSQALGVPVDCCCRWAVQKVAVAWRPKSGRLPWCWLHHSPFCHSHCCYKAHELPVNLHFSCFFFPLCSVSLFYFWNIDQVLPNEHIKAPPTPCYLQVIQSSNSCPVAMAAKRGVVTEKT